MHDDEREYERYLEYLAEEEAHYAALLAREAEEAWARDMAAAYEEHLDALFAEMEAERIELGGEGGCA